MTSQEQFHAIARRIEALGVPLNPASAVDLSSWEAAQGVTLPEQFREYFLCIAGARGIALGHVTLYGLQHIKRFAESLRCEKGTYPGLFTIGDYDDWVFGYAASFTDHADTKIYGAWNCAGSGGVVSPTLVEFLTMLVAEPDSIALVPKDSPGIPVR